MSGDLKCPACIPLSGGAMQCETGRPGCVRAAGTEGGAWDYPEEDDELVRGLRDRAFKRAGGNPQVGAPHTRTVEWRGAEEIARLRAEVERLTAWCAHYEAHFAAGYFHDDAGRVCPGIQADVELRAEGAMPTPAEYPPEAAPPDRAARDRAVAEAVREAAAEVAGELWYDPDADAHPRHITDGIRSIDLDAVTASVAKEARHGDE